MTSEGFGEMFEGDSADMCAGKFSLMLMGGRVEGLACADLEARTPISASVYYSTFVFQGPNSMGIGCAIAFKPWSYLV